VSPRELRTRQRQKLSSPHSVAEVDRRLRNLLSAHGPRRDAAVFDVWLDERLRASAFEDFKAVLR
jgi:hypothetical protein